MEEDLHSQPFQSVQVKLTRSRSDQVEHGQVMVSEQAVEEEGILVYS